MVFKGPAGFQRIIYIVMNLVIGILVGAAVTLFVVHAPLTLTGMIVSMALSFFIGYSVSDLVPAMAWGQALVAKLGVKNPIAAHFISSAVLAFFMSVLILFFMAIINILGVGGFEAVLGFFVSAFPLVLAVVYVAILVFVPIGSKLAAAISGFNPSQAKKPQRA